MKKLLTLLTFFVITISSYAFDAYIDGIYYNIRDSKTATVIGGDNKYSGEVVIPSVVTVNGITYSVTSIGESAFYGCSDLTSVTIPNSVTSIESWAFEECRGLTSITIPSSVTSMGDDVFRGCYDVKELIYADGCTKTLPTSLPYIENVVIPNSVTSIGNFTFCGCEKLSSVIIPNSVTSIGNGAFELCPSLTSVTIPNSVTSIGSSAFSGCSGLTSITIPNSVTSIGESALNRCDNLTSINVEVGNTKYDSRDNSNAIIETNTNTLLLGCKNSTIPNSVVSIGKNAFSGCSGLTSVTIPNSVTSIGRYAFSSCKNLASVTIPNSVTSIGYGAFNSCSGLTSITIPNSVTSIGDNAFYGCSGLTSITIPNSVTSIEGYAFYGCSGLTSVTIPNSVTSIGERAFMDCSSLTSVFIPKSVTNIASDSFSGCDAITCINVEAGNPKYDSRDNCNAIIETSTNVLVLVCKNTTIPNSVTSIGERAFYGCNDLKTFNIPNSVTSIGKNAFADCKGLTSITIGNSVESIGEGAFSNCESLTSVFVPKSVANIASDSFSGCRGLTSISIEAGNTKYDSRDNCNAIIETNTNTLVLGCKSSTIPNSVTSIGSAAFGGCSGLTSITIPNSVTNIGSSAFSGSGLSTLNIPNSVTSIGEHAFSNCKDLISITIPNSVTVIAEEAFSLCTSLTSIEIPNSVTSIEHQAFWLCTGLTSVIIGNSVTSIGNNVFYGCSNLTSVNIPNSVTSMGGQVFRKCSSLTSISIPASVKKMGVNMFWECTGLEHVYCYAKEVPLLINAFNSVDLSSVTLHVPASALNAYRSIVPWSDFGKYQFIPVPVEDITISASKNKLSVGDKITLYAFISPNDAVVKDVAWRSYDPNVVSVNSAGEITAVSAGTATIIAQATDGSGVTGSIEITVEDEKAGGEESGGEDDPSIGDTVDATPRPTSGNYMYVEKLKVKPGQTVQIPVELVLEEQYDEEIVGFQCNIKLPEGMEFVKNAKGNVVFTWNNDRIDGHTITSKIAADGSVKLLAASMNGSTFVETEGVMFYFSATVPEGMEGEQALQLYNVRVSDIDDNEIRCPDMTSVIDVKTYTLGDLNDDGEWSVVDVTMAIKAILDETYIEAGDMNEDGEMSVVDATTIIKYVLNEGPIEKASAPAAKRLKANAIADKPKFVVSPIYVEPGTNNMYLTVDMLNKQEYIGFQTEICLPEGFKFYTNSKGKPTVTLNTDRLETHTATSKLKDERTLRILVASMESDPILDNEGELLRVRVVADANVEAGNHTATLIDSRVSDDNDIETKLDVTNGYLRVFGEEAISLVVPEGGYATLCLPYNATVPAGLKAYKATGMKNGMVVIEEQTSIAACTPLVIQGTVGTYNFSGDNSGADEFEYSVGSLKSSLVPVENNSGYVLQNLSEGLGFYKIADALTVPSFRCVLDGASVSAAPAFVPVGFEEDANAIEAIGNKPQTTDSVYTLDGKRVKTMEKGKIYIVDGVKMIVK